MAECKNLCNAFVSIDTCNYCQNNYEVSTEFYKAKRYISDSWVIGYLVKLKNNGEIQGILNKNTNFAELAYIDESTITQL